MRKYKYDDALATGAIAAGGSIGILIPPSVILIIYGIITEQSIGKLFLAGFIPGFSGVYPRNHGGGLLPFHHMVSHLIKTPSRTERSQDDLSGKDRCP
jgi:hypothetical protein